MTHVCSNSVGKIGDHIRTESVLNWSCKMISILKNDIVQWKQKVRKIEIIFDVENCLWKSIFCTSWQNTVISFDDIDWPKAYSIILYLSLGNLTTHIAITPDSVCEDDSPICTESTMLRYCIIPDYKKKCCQSCLDA